MDRPLDEVLDEAADYIDEHGWVRGTYYNNKGSACAVGALIAVTSSDALAVAGIVGPMNARWIDNEIVKDPYTGHAVWLSDFNDNVAKDKRQVTRLLRRLAKRWREQHEQS